MALIISLAAANCQLSLLGLLGLLPSVLLALRLEGSVDESHHPPHMEKVTAGAGFNGAEARLARAEGKQLVCGGHNTYIFHGACKATRIGNIFCNWGGEI